MLYWDNPLKTTCADKYAVRSYVKQLGLEHMLPTMLAVYENATDINFDVLPDRFVLKCTHGSKMNYICRSKSTLDKANVISVLNSFLKKDISMVSGEKHYSLIPPRIICEAFLNTSSNALPIDYKLYCFSGKAHCTLVCIGRNDDGHGASYYYYNREWTCALPYNIHSINNDDIIPKPYSYDDILHAAELLSKPFPFVRIDFYDIDGLAVFGEMTFTPDGCIDTELTDIAEKELGEMLLLPRANAC